MSQTYGQPDPATSQPAGAAADRRTRLVLLGTWAALTLAAFAYVVSAGTNLPWGDEWDAVPVLTGHAPVRPWLYAADAGYRAPLSRALFYTLYQPGHDFRSGMASQVAILSVLSLGLIHFAARLRGRPHWADAFFPISLLHTGHWANLLAGSQVGFAVFLALVVGLGVVALRTTRQNAFRSGVMGGVLAAVLCLCGPFGLVLALAATAWLAYLVAVVWRTGPGWRSVVLATLALVPWACSAVGLIDGRTLPTSGVPDPRVAVAALAMAFGPGLGGIGWAVGAGIVLLLGVTLRVLPWDADGRVSSLGLITLAAGLLLLTVLPGLGGGNGPLSRYAFLTWPLLGGVFLIWARRGEWGGKWVPVLLCATAGLGFPGNTGVGIVEGSKLHSELVEIQAEITLGVPAEAIAARHFHGTPRKQAVTRAVPLLRGR